MSWIFSFPPDFLVIPRDMMAHDRSCLIVIVNYRTANLVIDCLRSLEPEIRKEPSCRVVVVDNASPDQSLGRMTDVVNANRWSWATVVDGGRNAGFAAGNNVAIRPALASGHPPRFIHLLNPDTIVHPGAITALIDYLQQHPQVGIVGSRLENLDGSLQSAAFRFHGVWSEFDRGFRLGIMTKLLTRYIVAPPPQDCVHSTDWVCGASMMIRKEVFDTIGLMDEDYFLYYEETDFCMRANRADWGIHHVPSSRVTHLEGQSTGLSTGGQSTKPVPGYWFASRRRYFRKHHGTGYEFLVNLMHTIGYSIWKLRAKLQRKPNPDPPGYLRDFVRKALLASVWK